MGEEGTGIPKGGEVHRCSGGLVQELDPPPTALPPLSPPPRQKSSCSGLDKSAWIAAARVGVCVCGGEGNPSIHTFSTKFTKQIPGTQY